MESGVGGAMRPEDDPGWASYADTILEFPGVPRLVVDLRRPVSELQIRMMTEAGLAGEFGLVTPCNPRGRELPEGENAERLECFLSELGQSGLNWVRVDGWNRGRDRVERGVGLTLPLDEVTAIARRWQQSAIYWFDGSRFWVHGALTDAPPWLLEVAG